MLDIIFISVLLLLLEALALHRLLLQCIFFLNVPTTTNISHDDKAASTVHYHDGVLPRVSLIAQTPLNFLQCCIIFF